MLYPPPSNLVQRFYKSVLYSGNVTRFQNTRLNSISLTSIRNEPPYLLRFLRDNRITTLCSDLYRKALKSDDKCGDSEKEFTCRNSLNPLQKRSFHCDHSREAHNRSLLIELYPNRTTNIESTDKI